jgi:hypothetical protein
MFSLGLQLLLAAAPGIYKLFTSDDKSEAVKDLTKDVLKTAGEKLGINIDSKDDLTKHLETNPESVIKLKQMEYDYSVKIQNLTLEDKKLDFEHENTQEGFKTEKWKSDNQHGSNFAKLLRPGLTVYLVFIVTILAIADGNFGEFSIKEVWVTLFTSLALTAVGGYFVLRTYEKRTGTSKWN